MTRRRIRAGIRLKYLNLQQVPSDNTTCGRIVFTMLLLMLSNDSLSRPGGPVAPWAVACPAWIGTLWRRVDMLRYVLLIFLLIVILAGCGGGGTSQETSDPPPANPGKTYYVDAAGGNDNNPGTSADNAWRTLSKVSASSFSPGDSILLKRGGTWREPLTVRSSGSAGQPITFGAYGSGNNPEINGANILSSWSNYGSNVWTATVAAQPRQVFFNGARGTPAANVAAVNGTNKWHWSGNVLYVYSTADPGTAYTSPGIEASVRESCVSILNKSHITVDGLSCQKSNMDGYYMAALGVPSLSGITLRNSTSANAGRVGFYLEGDASSVIDGVLISGCASSYSYSHGFEVINVTGGGNGVTIFKCLSHHDGQVDPAHGISVFTNTGRRSSRVTVSRCEIYNTRDAGGEGNGLQFDTESSDNIAEYNYVHDNEGLGIVAANGGGGNTVRYNLISKNGRNGIGGKGDGIAANNIYNNVLYKSSGSIVLSGIILYESGTFNVKNNIVQGFSSFGIDVNAGVNATCSNNAFYGNIDGAAHSVNCSNSVTADPMMTDPENGIFTLQRNSPAIDAGSNVDLTTDYAGNRVPVGPAPDIGAFEYQ